MSSESKTTLVLISFTLACLVLRSAFVQQWWGAPKPLPAIPLVDPRFLSTATVRTNAAMLIKSGGDTSGLDCYACHDHDKPPPVTIDKEGRVKLPSEHAELTLRHGRNLRNNSCFNCHDPANLDQLVTRSGRHLKFEESTLLCASCHGPTYRDWEIGVHGRVSGYWKAQSGPAVRQDCTACHDPHNPAFTHIQPAPGPHNLRQPAPPAAPDSPFTFRPPEPDVHTAAKTEE